MSWFRAGTVNVTNNSPLIIGVSVDFATNVRVGDAFIGPDGRQYEVANIASTTMLSINPVYQGVTANGAAYSIMPVQGYPKALADAFNNLNVQYGPKLAALGTTGNFEVLPISKGGTGAMDAASARQGLGLGPVATDVIVPIARGGTGATTPDSARLVLGLGTSATRNSGSYLNQVMQVGDRDLPLAPSINSWGNSFQIWNDTTVGRPEASQSGTIINVGWQGGNYGSQILMSFSGRIWLRSGDYTNALMREIYTTGNTTRGSGGALSAASPIVRIANVSASQRLDLQEQTFKPAGEWGVANSEASGVSVERLGVGEYRITGSLGLALEGWRTQDPCSPDGGRALGITGSEQSDEGTIIIKLFKQRWTLTDDGEMISGRGAALDVPLNSWIDVRLEMPKPAELPTPMAGTAEE